MLLTLQYFFYKICMVKKMNNEFNEYYYKYLGINEDDICKLVVSRNREEKINDFMYYPVIMTKIDEENVISVSQNLYEEIKEEIGKRNSNKVTEVIGNVINRKYENCKMKKMYRMGLDDILDIDISKVVKVEEKHKKIFLNSKKKRNIDEDEKNGKSLINI